MPFEVDLILELDPVDENPDTVRCPACGAGLYLNDGICSACGQIICPGCGHPLDDPDDEDSIDYNEADDEICPACALALSFSCPGCDFPVATGAKLCPECGLLFVRQCPGCGARILDGKEACPDCDQPFSLERRTFATIFASVEGLVLLRCPACTTHFGSELGACEGCGQRICPQCFLLLKDQEADCPHCNFHAVRPCPGCGQDVGLGLAECPHCERLLCPICGKIVGENDTVCRNCGTDLPLYCPVCGTEVGPADQQCPSCGEPFEEA
jgi:predicted amidophosphoribosyltransferase